MTFMGAAYVAMGLFFSSVTRNQIVAQLITFTAMIFLTVPYFILYGSEQRRSLSEGMMKFLEYTSYLYQMREMVSGKVHLIYVFLHLGFTLVWLVLTWIVLASRRWK
jgi:ABC-2 type transport system permease protein